MSEAVLQVLGLYFQVLGVICLLAYVVGLILVMRLAAREKSWGWVLAANVMLWVVVVPGVIWIAMFMFGSK